MGYILNSPLLIFISLFVITERVAYAASSNGSVNSMHNRYICGPNALLMFSVLSGRSDITYEDLGYDRINKQGVSLSSLNETAKRLGLSTEIRYYSEKDISVVNLPAIALFNNHYVVIYRTDSKYFYLLDGTTALRQQGLISSLPDFWSGYVIVNSRDINQILMSWIYSSAPYILSLECLVLLFLLRKKLSFVCINGSVSNRIAKLFVLHNIFLNAVSGNTSEFDDVIWRIPENSGYNVMYCYLRIVGKHVNYSQLMNDYTLENTEEYPYTMASLQRLASKYVDNAELLWISMKRLMEMEKPVIVHIDGITPDTGTYLLVIDVTRDNLLYMDGISASVRLMSIESFRRIWTGAALVMRDGKTDLFNVSFGCFLIVGICIPFLISKYTSRQQLHRRAATLGNVQDD